MTDQADATVAAGERMDTENARLSELGYKPELLRPLSLADVAIYGLIYKVPIAPISGFGVVYNLSVGAAGAVYVITALVMTFSALIYREMALQFPVAGSVYSYVRLGTSTFIGFISGWAILLDYLLLPALLCVFASLAMASEVPLLPSWVWVILFVAATAIINIMGVSVTARMNKLFLVIQLAMLSVFVVWATELIVTGHAHLSLDVLIPSSHSSW